jgi:HIT domain
LPISVVDETADVLALMDIQPVNPGHVLIIPKRHAPYLADLDATLSGHIFAVGMRVAAALRTCGVRKNNSMWEAPMGSVTPNPFCRCTHWKPSCLVMAAIAIAPPTVLGRAMENFTKPIVVSTRKRARSTAWRIGNKRL